MSGEKATTDRDEIPGSVLGALGDLPVFPLPGAVLFPRALLPLHIFEPRYRAMLAFVLGSHRAMVLAQIEDEGDRDAQGRPRFARVGGLGVVVEHRPLPDGRAHILLQGLARVALEERQSDDPFRRVRATVLQDARTPVPDADRAALLGAATTFAASLEPRADLGLAFPPDATAGVLADLCAQHLLFDPKARQALLEERDPAARVLAVTTELTLQQQALRKGAGRVLN
jgi:Lon protease-like protein